MLTYSVKLEPQREGGYTVTVPSLPGCVSEGETIEEALSNIKDAIEGYIYVLAKHKRTIPLEFSQEKSVKVFSETRRKAYAKTSKN